MSWIEHAKKSGLAVCRGILRPVVKLQKIFGYFRCGVWIITGRERYGGGAMAVGYAGTDYSKSYFVRMAFADDSTERYLGRRWVFNALRAVRRVCSEVTLFACEVQTPIEKLYCPDGFAKIPIWMRMEADISEAAPVWRSKRFIQTEKLVKREEITCERTLDAQKFSEFYTTMYLPYIVSRHQDAAVVDSLSQARAKFEEGGWELLLISKDEVILGGIVMGCPDGVARFCWLAANQQVDFLKRSLTDILYFFAVVRGREMKSSILNLGHVRAFLSDGVLWYKTQWGGRVLNQCLFYDGKLTLRYFKESEALKSFLRNNAFLGINPDGTYSVNGFVGDSKEDADREIYWNSRIKNEGMIGLRVFELWPWIRLRETQNLYKMGPERVVADVV